MTAARCPSGLGPAGRAVWRRIHAELPSGHVLDAAQLVQLEEVCRTKDRLDKLDAILRGDVETWARVQLAEGDIELKVDHVLQQANATANLMKQLIAALRLPDADTGKRPQTRPPRGGHAPKTPAAGNSAAAVSSLDRHRARAAGSS